MLKKYPLIGRAVIFILMPCLLLIVFMYQSIVSDALPPEKGSLTVQGIQNTVKILRDQNGVPHLKANHDLDIYFAMGFVHAQDRLWQLELQKRLSQGRLSEIFGKSMLDTDIWIRTLGIYQSAKKSMSHLSPKAIASLQAYSNGINEWISNNSNNLPIEFLILGVEPEYWKVEDSLAWSKMFALDLGGNLGSELQRFVASQYLNKQQLSTLFPALHSTELDVTTNADNEKSSVSVLDKFEAFKQTTKLGSKYAGSNAWVISGRLTETKSAILTNDPHLGLQIPSLWYAVSQEGELLNTSGMSLVGLPVVVFGRNQKIAWGGTNMMADVQDLYIENPVVGKPGYYQVGERTLPFETTKAMINVKSEFPSSFRNPLEPVEIEIRNTIHGPIVSDGVPGIEQPVSLRWTALAEEDTTYESFFRLSYATDWESFKQALSYHVAPTLNMLFADSEDNIGYISVGKIPLRSKGNGMLPVSGSSGGNDWLGYVPFSEMPQNFNPPSGYIVSANNKNVDANYPYFVSNDWADPARAVRIEQLINQKVKQGEALNSTSMIEILADELDLSTGSLRDYISNLSSEDPRQLEAIQYVKKWDGRVTRDSQASSIYFGWLRQVKQKLFGDEIGASWNKKAHSRILENLVSTISHDAINSALNNQEQWCDDISTIQKENCNQISLIALDAALDELIKLRGDDISDWEWGELQSTLYSHSPFSQMKLLDSIFERRIGNGGSANSINVAGSSFDKSDGYVQTFGAGFRQIISFNPDGTEHLYMNSPGQSGQVGSKHYDDMLEKFRDVEFFKFPTHSQLEGMQLIDKYFELNPGKGEDNRK